MDLCLWWGKLNDFEWKFSFKLILARNVSYQKLFIKGRYLIPLNDFLKIKQLQKQSCRLMTASLCWEGTFQIHFSSVFNFVEVFISDPWICLRPVASSVDLIIQWCISVNLDILKYWYSFKFDKNWDQEVCMQPLVSDKKANSIAILVINIMKHKWKLWSILGKFSLAWCYMG